MADCCDGFTRSRMLKAAAAQAGRGLPAIEAGMPLPAGTGMDRRQFFGDSVGGTLIRLVLLSVVVGVVFSALGITPFNLIERLQHLIRNITDMGLDAFNWAFRAAHLASPMDAGRPKRFR